MWANPLEAIAALVAFELLPARALIAEAVDRMRREKLIIASPKSIQAVATAVHGERQGAAVCATKMPDGRIIMPN
jgi:hypothetical protein